MGGSSSLGAYSVQRRLRWLEALSVDLRWCDYQLQISGSVSPLDASLLSLPRVLRCRFSYTQEQFR